MKYICEVVQPFVEKLASNPEKVPEVKVFVGFEGPSNLEGHTRLYLTPSLDSFYDIPISEILYGMPGVPCDKHPFVPVYLWVNANANLINKGRATENGLACFLRGELSNIPE